MFTEQQEAEPQDVSRFQAFVRTAARAAGNRPERTWPAPDGHQVDRSPACEPLAALV